MPSTLPHLRPKSDTHHHRHLRRLQLELPGSFMRLNQTQAIPQRLHNTHLLKEFLKTLLFSFDFEIFIDLYLPSFFELFPLAEFGLLALSDDLSDVVIGHFGIELVAHFVFDVVLSFVFFEVAVQAGAHDVVRDVVLVLVSAE